MTEPSNKYILSIAQFEKMCSVFYNGKFENWCKTETHNANLRVDAVALFRCEIGAWPQNEANWAASPVQKSVQP